MTNKKLVSIVMPAYNSARFIGESIKSVQRQNFQDWELIIIDDGSVDDTEEIIKKYAKEDGRIKYFRNTKNQGSARARNRGVKESKGRYIAFIDSDDLWYEEKLSKQVEFMIGNGCSISCTGYQHMNARGELLGRIIIPPQTADYNRVLFDNPIGNSTVMYDTDKIGKFYGPIAKNREDYALWLKILRKVKYINGISEILVLYRKRKGSQSSNKVKLIYYQWVLYRKFERMSFGKSLLLMIYWCVAKTIGIK